VPDCPDVADHPYPKGRMPAIRRVMVPSDTNAVGTIFGGTILSEIDLAAAITAHLVHPGRIVTVAMDKIEFKQPVHVGDLLSLFGTITKLGRSSIQMQIEVFAERRLACRETHLVTVAEVTMVAVDEDLRPTPIAEPERMHDQ